MQKELDALIENDTSKLVVLPIRVHHIICKWSFKVKILVNGALDKYMARLAARGFLQ